jgi:branched-chain amino acid transport system substrate-binding protein
MTHLTWKLFGILAITLFIAAPARAAIKIGVAAPLTGPQAWIGEQVRAGADLAVQDLNERGGMLGKPLATVLVDDFCDPDQAVAAAHKLVAEGVPVVVGHQCSGAAIPASAIYEAAGIILISPAATNPRLTERGLRYIFRTCGRDDLQGAMIGDHLAEDWPGAHIAIVHDGTAYGQGIAEEAKRRLADLGTAAALFAQVQPGQTEFSALVTALQAGDIDVVFYGGYAAEAGLIVRQAKARLPNLGFVVPDGVASEDFCEGTLFTSFGDPTHAPGAAEVMERLQQQLQQPNARAVYSYAAVQVWAQAVEKAGTLEARAVAAALRANRFDTVFGTIGFDAKGDVTGYEPFVWYIWRAGNYAPVDPGKLTE